MPASGIEVKDEVTTVFNRIKQSPKDLHWVKFGMSDGNKSIEVKSKLEKTEPFDITNIEECFQGLDKDDCFYMVIDVNLPVDADGVKLEKLVFIQWIPDTAAIKKKMMYASSADSLKQKLTGLGGKIEAHDLSDVTFEAVKAAIAAARGKSN